MNEWPLWKTWWKTAILILICSAVWVGAGWSWGCGVENRNVCVAITWHRWGTTASVPQAKVPWGLACFSCAGPVLGAR